jgi:hypothetical protein
MYLLSGASSTITLNGATLIKLFWLAFAFTFTFKNDVGILIFFD